MLKVEKDYKEKYGEIPLDSFGRMDYLLNEVNLKKAKENVYERIDRITSIKWKHISYTIYLLPQATPRPRSGMNGIFYVKGAKDNKKIFNKFFEENKVPMIYTPCKFYCKSYFPIPKSMTAVEKVCAEMSFIRPTSKPDWDNVAKTYCDMLQDTLLYDDSLIVEGSAKKYYSVKPRIEIDIYYMEDFDSKYNENKIKNRKVVS